MNEQLSTGGALSRHPQQNHWLPAVDFRLHRVPSFLLRQADYRDHLVLHLRLAGHWLVDRPVPDPVHGP
ncbi:hypothetical protein D9M71_851410 [compost metagenome]